KAIEVCPCYRSRSLDLLSSRGRIASRMLHTSRNPSSASPRVNREPSLSAICGSELCAGLPVAFGAKRLEEDPPNRRLLGQSGGSREAVPRNAQRSRLGARTDVIQTYLSRETDQTVPEPERTAKPDTRLDLPRGRTRSQAAHSNHVKCVCRILCIRRR